MIEYIPKVAVLTEIEKTIADETESIKSFEHSKNVSEVQRYNARISVLKHLLSIIDTLEVKEMDNMPNIRFPHYEDIVEKVFGAGNLEFFEHDEAEQLVSLAKEELLKDLEVKEADFEEVFNDEYSRFSNDTDAMDYAFPIDLADYRDFAKHFFELGIKVLKHRKENKI